MPPQTKEYVFRFKESVKKGPEPADPILKEIYKILIGIGHNGNLGDRVLYTHPLLESPTSARAASDIEFLRIYRTALVASMKNGYLASAFDDDRLSKESVYPVMNALNTKICEVSKV